MGFYCFNLDLSGSCVINILLVCGLCGVFIKSHKKLACFLKGNLLLQRRHFILKFYLRSSWNKAFQEKAFSCSRRVKYSVPQLLFRSKEFSVSFKNWVEGCPGILLAFQMVHFPSSLSSLHAEQWMAKSFKVCFIIVLIIIVLIIVLMAVFQKWLITRHWMNDNYCVPVI